MTLYAIDPGTEQSALVAVGKNVVGDILLNDGLLRWLSVEPLGGHLVIEQIECYGMAVGREVFETVFWAGRFAQAWEQRHPDNTWSMLPRRDVKLALCGSARAKDANIRAALLDRYGGKASAKKGGPLYGIKSHLWSALALAETYTQLQREKGQ